MASLPHDPGSYKLHLTLWNGDQIEMEDPYRFPRLISDFDLHIHGEGTQYESYRTMGAHLVECRGRAGRALRGVGAERRSGQRGRRFQRVGRAPASHAPANRRRLGDFIPGVGAGANYKYSVRRAVARLPAAKGRSLRFRDGGAAQSASIVCDLETYQWATARGWTRAPARTLKEPVSIYEVHLGSWMRGPHNSYLTYRELADKLVEYVERMGYTHLELLPIMEHPFSGSWGYQVVGYFAPTSRFGTPHDFMYFVDRCHQAGIGVIVDWVPGHFPKDAHGLALFRRHRALRTRRSAQGRAREWGTLIFNYGRNEVRTFLISNALFWLKEYHIDGLRVDAVASMLYLDYSRKPGEWIPNSTAATRIWRPSIFCGASTNWRTRCRARSPSAEESTAFAGVSRPVYLNGLGFTMKWNMGWMHDMLDYFAKDPVYRKYHHNNITFSMLYAFTENFVLPISHDEVVHGKGALLSKMPGDEWQKFANVRAFLAYMYAHPGKKLLFMGSEIGEWDEWNHEYGLPWDMLHYDFHRKLQVLVGELNRLYRAHPASMRSISTGRVSNGWISAMWTVPAFLSSGGRKRQAVPAVRVQLHARAAPAIIAWACPIPASTARS